MPSKLKAVAPEVVEPSKPKVLLFGKAGVGKTWSALDFPRCYYIDTEGGANRPHYIERLQRSGGVYLGPTQGSNDFSLVLEQVQALASEPHDYRTLVIDSVSHLFGTEVAAEQDRLAADKTEDKFGRSRQPAVSYMRRILNWIDRVDMNVIMIAHQKDEYGMINGKREAIGETFDCWEKVEYLLDLAMQIFRAGPAHKARVRKSRLLGFPNGESFNWSYDDFANRYGREIIEGRVKTVALADESQLKELAELLERIKMPDDWLSKCLLKGKSERIEEMSAANVAEMIKSVRKRAA